MTARHRLWLCAWVVGFSVATACLLLGFKHRAVLDGLQRARLQLVATEVSATIERSLTFGMALAEIPMLPGFLQSQRGTDPLIDSIEITDPTGRVLYATGASRGEAAEAATARNAFGLVVAHVAVRFSTQELDRATARFARSLAPWAAAIFAAMTAILFLALRASDSAMARLPPASRWRTLGLLALMATGTCAAILATAAVAHRELQRELPSEALRKAEAIGRSIDALATKAMRWGLPLERLPGIDELLSGVERKNPEIGSIAMRSGERVIASHGTQPAAAERRAIQLPLTTAGDPAVLEIALDPSWVARLLREMALDLAVIVVVAVVISVELVLYLARRAAGANAGPQAAADSTPANILGAMRAPFFLFLLSEDLSRSFLPLFARSLPPGAMDLPAHLVTSLPITLFMLIVALSQPSLGTWSERIGRRRAFLGGAVLGAAAQLLSANAGSLTELLAWRSAAGLAWAVAFVAAQGFVIDHTDRSTRTRGLASFVGIIMASLICGPSIGGLLADGLGPRWTFAIAAALAAAGGLLAWRDIPRGRPAAVAKPAGLRGYVAAVANPRFASLLLLAAIPAKIIVIAFCFYLLPLYVAQEGHSAATAGRIIMLYSVMMVLLVPVSAELVERVERATRRRPHAAFVAGGLALSGLAGISMLLPLGLAGAAALALLLGVAQAMSIAPQSAMVPEATGPDMQRVGESAIYGVYRLVERLGNAAGPVIAAYLVVASGFQAAFATIGVGVLVSGIAFYAIFRYTMKRAPRS